MMKHLFDMGGCETIAADTWRQALDTWCELTSEDELDYRDDLTKIPDDKEITIRWESDILNECRATVPATAIYSTGGGYILTTALAHEWAKATPRPMVICSTEW